MKLLRVIIGLVQKLYRYIYTSVDSVGYARSLGVKIGQNCRLLNVSFGTEPYLITLGDHVSATSTKFVTHDGGIWVFRDRFQDIDIVAPIKIGNNVYLGLDTVILPGVTIGDNVIIGARAVVTNDIPSNCVAVGIPARPIKSIDDYWKNVEKKTLPTKQMSRKDKRKYFLRHFGLEL